MKSFGKYILTSIKGACMGAADVIPGVSGGTIAFIMGIYDDFVGSIARIDKEAVKMLFKGQFKALWQHINGGFLLSLIIGILVSVVALAGIMQRLLDTHPIQTWAFFFGLIVASSIFILKGISGWRIREGIMLVLGVALGVVICTLSPTQTPDDLWFIFLSGALAICAMILPGISGSFILLILGKYEYIMESISDLTKGIDVADNLIIMGIFWSGAIVGILGFSKFLRWLLGKWHKETLIVLAGFIIGSLVKIWPWTNIEAIITSQHPDVAQALAGNQVTAGIVDQYAGTIDPQIGSAVIFAIIGFALVLGIEYSSKMIANRKK